MTLDVLSKRIYDPPDASDGYRILIDHIWPRGVSRDRACLGRLTILYAPATATTTTRSCSPSFCATAKRQTQDRDGRRESRRRADTRA